VVVSQSSFIAVSIKAKDGRQFFPGPPVVPGAPENGVIIKNFTFSAYHSDGKAQRSPFVLYRVVDTASPVLLSALISNAVLPEIKLVALLRSDGTTHGTGKRLRQILGLEQG
jgi:hypothetical protein